MLDQNTDRMWYVIGAVIIGAAIILIMNKTFPQLFASVGETIKSKTEQTTAVVDGIMPKDRTNLIRNASFSSGHDEWYSNGTTRVEMIDGRSVMLVSPGVGASGGGIYQTGVLTKTSAVEITFDARAVSGTATPLFGFLNTKNAADAKVITLNEKWQTISIKTTDIDATSAHHNVFHMYSNMTKFYVDNVKVKAI